MPRRPLQSLIVLSLILFLGMPWMCLQTVAWVGMVLNYSQTLPLKSAVSKALDGKHPCAICKVVQSGQKKDKEPSGSRSVVKFVFLSATTECRLFPPLADCPEAFHPPVPSEQNQSPPVPPPRGSSSSPV
ncbi:MAG TPA: hypothetical protein VK968_05935 [Roseimicrobium sp.]|nr:hypothetical protein [Roseimicrobium sp.]